MEYTIDSFVESLLIKKGVTGLSDEVFAQMKEDLIERAEDMINAEILANMPENCLEEFDKLLDEGDSDKIQIFCAEKIPNLDEVTAGALINLHKLYLASSIN
jgi:hypothetical protein